MEDTLEEKTLYEAISRIRYISKKRPQEDIILKQASKTSGLAIEHLHKTLSSLVDKGNICISKSLQGSHSCYVLNIEDPEAIVEHEDQSDVSDGINDPVNFEFPTPRAELQLDEQKS